ncbi:RagB/SusD family nutrient uptake outer membrane protein [Pedobacter nyackensis]|uniref:SusD family protein n=1 Tax=Pedobacter nyackensis TaxID=475255 RepID=A0A1W2DWN7_9SPHI|nr:RagB/SusD family nutrient uptake outer membrane protein [Pedobacter nyackensis]SMD01338.1 SusD family protein [Pedobacter nyackensis]
MKLLIHQYCIYLAILVSFTACKKDFLDAKPSSDILAPATLEELNTLLENVNVTNKTGALAQVSCDDYRIVSDQNFLSLPTATERNAYLWQKEIYEGESSNDWNIPFSQIFYANSVLQVIQEKNLGKLTESNITKGWAYFVRAYALFDLARNFAPSYRLETATTDLGIPLRQSAGVDQIIPRSSLQETFDQILSDLTLAGNLLQTNIPEENRNRPSKVAALAMKARVYLYMGNYTDAERYCDSTLLFHNKLIDYNAISRTSDTPFGYNSDEVIYQSTQIVAYGLSSGVGNPMLSIEVNPDLYRLYASGDLRRTIYFKTNSLGRINMKRGYIGAGIYNFTGLATDEIYLIKAECLARRGASEQSMEVLNGLLIRRFNNKDLYVSLKATSPSEALTLILQERRKELIWRALRWSDLKRLNKEGANITLTRTINNITYTLLPNDPRYVFPIPDQEINYSGIQQNIR